MFSLLKRKMAEQCTAPVPKHLYQPGFLFEEKAGPFARKN
jgi:hypothetical protein